VAAEGALDRVWSEAFADPRLAMDQGLSPTDLQTLLLGMAKARAEHVTPGRVLRRWQEDAFVKPSASDPRRLSRFEAALWSRLPEGFDGLELSPVAPFGACSAVAGVDQNRVLTTTRTNEVLSDPTVVLAVAAAARRKENRHRPVHLAACHRVLRTQRFRPPFQQHFRLFALVSSDRDVGSGRTEAALLVSHLSFYVSALAALLPEDRVRVRLSAFQASAGAERLIDTVVPALDPLPPNVEVSEDSERQHGRGYYQDLALRIDVIHDGEEIEVGDGGLTDWTARLLPDAKERCLTSCIATERLAAICAG